MLAEKMYWNSASHSTSHSGKPDEPTGSTSKSLSVRAQKKILATMAGHKNVAKLFIDDKSAHLLDTLHRLTRDRLPDNKRRADKLLKYSIKSAIKFLVLLRTHQLNASQLQQIGEFRRKLRLVAVTFISFYEVDFSFDRAYLSGLLHDCGQRLTSILGDHLTAKSIGRIDEVFHFYGDEEFLQWLFVEHRENADLRLMVADLHHLLGENAL